MKEGRGIEPLCTRLSNAFQKERVSGHLAIQQYTKAHSGYSLSYPIVKPQSCILSPHL